MTDVMHGRELNSVSLGEKAALLSKQQYKLRLWSPRTSKAQVVECRINVDYPKRGQGHKVLPCDLSLAQLQVAISQALIPALLKPCFHAANKS